MWGHVNRKGCQGVCFQPFFIVNLYRYSLAFELVHNNVTYMQFDHKP